MSRTIDDVIHFMKQVENPEWMVDLVVGLKNKNIEYENLKKQGLLVELPCKAGDIVRYTDEYSIFDFVVEKIVSDEKEISIYGHGKGCVVYARNFDKYCKVVS